MKFLKLDIDQCYAYLVASKDNEAILIDPKLDYADFYLNLLEEKKLKLKLVIDTHSHADHLTAGPYLKEKTGCTYAMHENNKSTAVDRNLKHNEKFSIGDLDFTILYTPGHTDNSISVICNDKLFTGDNLFLTGSGRDDLPTGNFKSHYNSLKIISNLENYLIVCPGHNYTNDSLSSLWLVKKENPLLNCSDLEDYKEKSKPSVTPGSWMGDVVNLNNQGNMDINAIKMPKTKSVCQSGAGNEDSFDEVTYINKKELKKLISEKDVPILIDVRNPDELLDISPITTAMNIPLPELPTRLKELKKFNSKTIVSICASGARAVKAAKMIKSVYPDAKVLVLKGGMREY